MDQSYGVRQEAHRLVEEHAYMRVILAVGLRLECRYGQRLLA